jgi:hypothetical protein
MWLAAGASLANCLGAAAAAGREITETAQRQARWQSDRQPEDLRPVTRLATEQAILQNWKTVGQVESNLVE